MLFIKNFAESVGLQNEDLKIVVTEKGSSMRLSLETEVGAVDLLTSELEGLSESIKHSISVINKKHNKTSNTEVALCSDFTELAFYSKAMKTVLVSGTNAHGKRVYNIPTEIEGLSDEEFSANVNKNHYPRDIIVLVVPEDTDDKSYRCVCDKRNLEAPIVTKSVPEIGPYKLICLVTKWPGWAYLKFPAYAYITTGDQLSDVVGAFKLSFLKTGKSLRNKNVMATRNHLEFVDYQVAFDFISESRRIQEQQANSHKRETGGSLMDKPYMGVNNKKSNGSKNPSFRGNGSREFVSEKVRIPSYKTTSKAGKGNQNHRAHGKMGR